MLYVEGISALEYWLSPARVVHDGQNLPKLSSLEDCPRTSRESSWQKLDDLPCNFDFVEKPTLAIPGREYRAQRERFKYHVWSHEIPKESFLQVSNDAAVACSALAIGQVGHGLREEHIAQVVCSLAGSYITMPGKHGGMIDKLTPLVTIEELRKMAGDLEGLCSTKKLVSALEYAAENSASPAETNLLLLLSMTRRKGGADIRGWEMNVEMEVPFKFRRYLGQSHITPDLLAREQSVVLEYDSNERHGDKEQQEKDKKRVVVLQAMGYKVIAVHTADVRNALAFQDIIDKTLEALGKKPMRTSPAMFESRQKLIDSLRNNPLLS